MDLTNPTVLFSSLFIGLIGFALFLYGKKQADLKCLAVGLVMCIFPYFVTSVITMWAVTGGCLASLYFLPRFAD